MLQNDTTPSLLFMVARSHMQKTEIMVKKRHDSFETW